MKICVICMTFGAQHYKKNSTFYQKKSVCVFGGGGGALFVEGYANPALIYVCTIFHFL